MFAAKLVSKAVKNPRLGFFCMPEKTPLVLLLLAMRWGAALVREATVRIHRSKH